MRTGGAYALSEEVLHGRQLPGLRAQNPKIPREGGVLLAVGKHRQDIEAIAHEDPLYTKGLANVCVIEFLASQKAKDIQKRIETS
jgi:hypothetical protein